MRTWFVVLWLCLLVGCAPPRYRAAIVVEASDVSTDERVRYVGGATIAQVLMADAFWQRFVIPRMPETLRFDPKVRAGLVVSAGDDRTVGGKIIAHLDVELSYGGERAFDVICEAYSAYRIEMSREAFEYGKVELAKAKSLVASGLGEGLKIQGNERTVAMDQRVTIEQQVAIHQIGVLEHMVEKAEKDMARGFILKVQKP